jgi:hypothetical protein
MVFVLFVCLVLLSYEAPDRLNSDATNCKPSGLSSHGSVSSAFTLHARMYISVFRFFFFFFFFCPIER